jgi:hypothetical protein
VLEPIARVDHICKKKRAGRRIFFAQGGVRILGPSLATSGHTRWPRPCQATRLIAFEFFEFFLGVMRKFGDGPGNLGEWVYNTPIF